jgi:leader peptidase (prepilin peptidase)/N-methyltransferase
MLGFEYLQLTTGQPRSILGYVAFAVVGAAVGVLITTLIQRIQLEDCEVCERNEKHFSARFPIIAIVNAAIFAGVYWHDGLSAPLVFNLAFTGAMVALIFVDAEHMILPNVITYPGMAFALLARILIPYLAGGPYFDDIPSLIQGSLAGKPIWLTSLIGAVIGATIGAGFLWLSGWAWQKLRKVEAMGLGDVKMMVMVGAYLGWRLTILTIFAGVLSGSVIGVLLMTLERKYDGQKQLAFGVFLGAAAIGSLLFGVYLVEWYAGQFR